VERQKRVNTSCQGYTQVQMGRRT